MFIHLSKKVSHSFEIQRLNNGLIALWQKKIRLKVSAMYEKTVYVIYVQ